MELPCEFYCHFQSGYKHRANKAVNQLNEKEAGLQTEEELEKVVQLVVE